MFIHIMSTVVQSLCKYNVSDICRFAYFRGTVIRIV